MEFHVRSSSRGSISAFVVCSVMTLVSLAGLAFDGGRVVATYAELADAAQNAARMGDQFLVGVRAGQPRVDVDAGTRAVRDYLRVRGLSCDVSVEGRMISVTVRTSIHMRILSIIGVSPRRVEVTRRAALVEG
jgi:hypothetical protein